MSSWFTSNAGQVEGRALPSAMFTPWMSSSMPTVPPPSQSPVQARDGCGGGAEEDQEDERRRKRDIKTAHLGFHEGEVGGTQR